MPLPSIAGVVFDMDGTLTAQGAIDFAAIRRRLGMPSTGGDILAHIRSAPSAEERARLAAIVEEEEEAGIARQRLQPLAEEVLAHIGRAGLPVALLTRNNGAVAERTMALLSAPARAAFHVMLTRGTEEDALHPERGDPHEGKAVRPFYPCKPSGDAVHHLGQLWGVHPSAIAIVGDADDDMLCGRAAGAVTILIGCDPTCPIFTRALPHADHTVASHAQLAELLQTLAGLPPLPPPPQ
jgi:phosphoglycolate phosphatase-like HAD superfamily hydrolase